MNYLNASAWAAALFLSATGCGNDKGGTDPTPTPSASPTATPMNLVQFDDEVGLSDKVIVQIEDITAASSAQTYLVWLGDDAGSAWLKIAEDTALGGSILTEYVDAGTANLVATYSQAAVSLEDSGSAGGLTAPTPANIVLAGALSAEMRDNTRNLLVAWAGSPDTLTGSARGLLAELDLAEDYAHDAEDAIFGSADQPEAIHQSEFIYNTYAGEFGALDLDGLDGVETAVGSDGFGVLENGVNDGYLTATFALVGAAILNEANGSPAKSAGQGVIQCRPDMKALAEIVLASALGVKGAPDAETAKIPAERAHVTNDELAFQSESCVLNGIFDMAAIHLAAP